MLFKDAKQNQPIYILDKANFCLLEGKVRNISFPYIPRDTTQTGLSNMNASKPMVVDVTIEADGRTATYTIPENLSVTFSNDGNLVLSTVKEYLSNEVQNMQNTADQILSQEFLDRQKRIKEKAPDLLSELNPAFREKQENEKRLNDIESGLKELTDLMKGFVEKLG